jgi:branched-chain amino acid transport system substrate-binding protein
MRTSTPLLLLAAALAVACQKKQEPAPTQQQPASTSAPAAAGGDGPIVIGQVATITGDQATFGTSADNGVKLAIEEANAAGGVRGRKLTLKTYDAAGKPEEAATAATRLATEDKAVLMIGELASGRSLAMAPIADTNKVPMISPASTNPKVTKDGDRTRPFVFRVCFIDPMQGTVMARFVRDNLKLGKVAILRDVGSDYSVGLADYFTRQFTSAGGQIVADVSFKAGDQDFKAQLTAIKAKNPELVYVPAYYTDVALIGRQARELGMKMPMAGGDGWDSAKLYEIAQGALDGSYFSNHYTHENPAPVVQEFVKRYQAAFGGVPDAFAALGYDAGRVAVDALKRAPDLSGPAAAQAIADTKGFAGVTGSITFDADHNPIKSAVIIGIENNAPKYVATVAP